MSQRMSNERVRELLAQIRRRNDCFDLMCELFDRAKREENERGMLDAYNAMTLINKGGRAA
jgi:hypothetical protein